MQTQHGLAGANTEASLRFHRFHERLNRSLKTQVIGLGMLKDAIDKGETRDGIKEILYAQNDLWGGMPDWGRPQELIDEGRLDIGRAGVVRGFSAFDLFLDNLSAELESYGRFRGAKPKPKGRLPARQGGDGTDDGAAAAEAGLTRYYERIGADLDGVKFLLPLYVYFRSQLHRAPRRDRERRGGRPLARGRDPRCAGGVAGSHRRYARAGDTAAQGRCGDPLHPQAGPLELFDPEADSHGRQREGLDHIGGRGRRLRRGKTLAFHSVGERSRDQEKHAGDDKLHTLGSVQGQECRLVGCIQDPVLARHEQEVRAKVPVACGSCRDRRWLTGRRDRRRTGRRRGPVGRP